MGQRSSRPLDKGGGGWSSPKFFRPPSDPSPGSASVPLATCEERETACSLHNDLLAGALMWIDPYKEAAAERSQHVICSSKLKGCLTGHVRKNH